jgi:hypothetical protein
MARVDVTVGAPPHVVAATDRLGAIARDAPFPAARERALGARSCAGYRWTSVSRFPAGSRT